VYNRINADYLYTKIHNVAEYKALNRIFSDYLMKISQHRCT